MAQTTNTIKHVASPLARQTLLDTDSDGVQRRPIGPLIPELDRRCAWIQRQDRREPCGELVAQTGAAASSVAAGITSWANSFMES